MPSSRTAWNGGLSSSTFLAIWNPGRPGGHRLYGLTRGCTSFGTPVTDARCMPPDFASRRRSRTGFADEIGAPPMASDMVRVHELKTLYRHSTHYFVGMLGTMAVGFFSFPVFTRLFSVTDYGVLDLVQKCITFFIAFSKLGLQHAALRFYDAHVCSADRHAEQTYFSTMFFGTVLTSGCITLAVVAVMHAIPGAALDPKV